MLRLLSYLSPSLPEGLFRLVAEHLEESCGVTTALDFERRISGPLPGDDEPFSDGRADVGFVCAPTYRWLRGTVELLPCPVPLDPRAAGRPVYFADVVVPAVSGTGRFEELRGGRWAFNDRNSRSGWFSMLERVAELGGKDAFFRELVDSGSHLRSLDLVLAGGADAAAIDSNVLHLQLAARPGLAGRLRVLESWGPFAIQPVIVRATLPAPLKAQVAESLLAMHQTKSEQLAHFSFSRFAAAEPGLYGDSPAQVLR